MQHFTEEIKKSIRMRRWQLSLLLTVIHQHPLSSRRKCKTLLQFMFQSRVAHDNPEPVISSRSYVSRTAATYIAPKDISQIWWLFHVRVSSRFLLRQRLLKIYLTLKWLRYLVRCPVDQGWSGCRAIFYDFTGSAATHSGTNEKVIACQISPGWYSLIWAT